MVEDFRGGKKQAVGSLIGQARNKNPNANPAAGPRNVVETDRSRIVLSA